MRSLANDAAAIGFNFLGNTGERKHRQAGSDSYAAPVLATLRLLVAQLLVEHRQQGQQDETGDRQQHLRLVDRVLDAVRLARREDGTEAIADRSIDQRAGDDADRKSTRLNSSH